MILLAAVLVNKTSGKVSSLCERTVYRVLYAMHFWAMLAEKHYFRRYGAPYIENLILIFLENR